MISEMNKEKGWDKMKTKHKLLIMYWYGSLAWTFIGSILAIVFKNGWITLSAISAFVLLMISLLLTSKPKKRNRSFRYRSSYPKNTTSHSSNRNSSDYDYYGDE